MKDLKLSLNDKKLHVTHQIKQDIIQLYQYFSKES